MIKVIYSNKWMKVSGHANYAEYGKDIVCASVSSLITCTVNNISAVDSSSIKYKDDGNTIYLEIINNNEISYKLFNNLILMLKDLAKDYPKNIKIESEK